MSERRMFAKNIVDSDAFLDMPLSTQALYFHLSMRADDEGFINNPRKIQRMVGASDDDLKLLVAKNFIIPFDSGVVVIKHWRIHNYIRADRLVKTAYTEERDMLEIKDNGAYTLEYGRQMTDKSLTSDRHLTDICQTSDGQVTGFCPQSDSIGKDRLGKDSIGKVSIGEERLGESKGDMIRQVAEMYNETCVSYPSLRSLSDARIKTIKARLNTYTMDDFKTLFEKAEASSFLKGQNNRDWSATFDWLIKDSNMAKVLDGNYDDKKNKAADALSQSYEMISQWAGGNDEQG